MDRMNAHDYDERAVTAALRALASADRGMEAPAELESRLLEAFAATVTRPAEVRTDRRWMAIAAAFVLTVGSSVGWLAWERTSGMPARHEAAAATDFVPWPGATALPSFESGELVRTDLPVSVLPLLGITDVRESHDGLVTADLLIGQDGMVRAVRLAPNEGGRP
ncbi:MAG: hypothetical protein A3H96_26500 [Acidobacteria bacterium RIFCSPLOWO2_02_FULL_67_36]|nr:MAG: hypothetical protein A3H96_26500 [Acidobacteria bacterium RIFCSPLOWO2_02_FULL_67_36]OFW22830.1 MAG: hypothetical protein A3G21_05625 [Acidobacteria bacterium RIFCSPLOWO2_12_FULL_66_21]